MGLKPRYHSISLIRSLKLTAMKELRFNNVVVLLPSALADGLCKPLLNWALATL
jgi:hypothetical protein